MQKTRELFSNEHTLSAKIQQKRFWHQGKSPGTHFLLPSYVLVNHGALMVTTDFECTTVITKWQLEGSFGGSHTAARNITKTLLDSNLATYNQFLNVHIVCTCNYIHRNQPVPMSQAWRCLPQYYLQYQDTGDILSSQENNLGNSSLSHCRVRQLIKKKRLFKK